MERYKLSPARVLAASFLLLLGVVLSGCGSAKSGSGSARQATTALSSVQPATGGSVVATVPANQLTHPGRLVVCADEPSPPGTFYDSHGALKGYDVQLARDIGHRLGLATAEITSAFDIIILSVKTGKCDLAVDSMFVKPDRLKQVDMIPYVQIGQQFLLKKGAPSLGDPSSNPSVLCGKKIATVTGGAEEPPLRGFAATCKKGGHPAIRMDFFPTALPALQALSTGQIDALFLDYPSLAFYVKLHPTAFSLNSAKVLNSVKGAIAIAPGKPQLESAIAKAVKSLVSDGTYRKVLAFWRASDLNLRNAGSTILRANG